MWYAINAFNSGELSSKMRSRTDVSQYTKGCRTLENFLVTPYGAVERRAGTKFIARTENNSADIRLVKFEVSSIVVYVMEFGDKYIKFYQRDENGNTAFFQTLASCYTKDDINTLQFVQSADVMTICHPLHPVMELKRTAGGFTLAEKPFEYPAMGDPNIDDEFTLKVSAISGSVNLLSGNEVYLESSNELFVSSHVGAYFQLLHIRESGEISKDFEADGVTDNLAVKGNWTLTTQGTWTGKLSLQKSYDGGKTFSTVRTYVSNKNNNVSTDGTEDEDGAIYRICMEDYEESDTGTLKLCRVLLVNGDYQNVGVVKVTEYIDSKKCKAVITKEVGSDKPTVDWNEGAWSQKNGYPVCVAYYEERMIFGGTEHQPNTVWGSKTGDWDNFYVGGKDDEAISFTLSSDTVNTIAWMCQHDALIIGTGDSEWTLSASSTDAALTASDIKIRRQSVYGSGNVPAVMVGDVVLFVQRGGRKVREFVFSWEKNGYLAADLTILSDHITKGEAGRSEVVQTALQKLPDTVLWCVVQEKVQEKDKEECIIKGTASMLTYDREQQITGWQRFVTDGIILSVCVVPDGAADIVYLAVKRKNGVFIEALQPRDFGSIEDAFFVDCGIKAVGKDITTVSGLEHLEGMMVSVLADGAVQSPRVVTDGKILLDVPCQTAVVGLPYTSILEPMPPELDTQDGSTLCRRKSVTEVRLSYYDSVGGTIKIMHDYNQFIRSRDVQADRHDVAVQPKTETAVFQANSGYDTDIIITVKQADPLPLNISSMTIRLGLAE